MLTKLMVLVESLEIEEKPLTGAADLGRLLAEIGDRLLTQGKSAAAEVMLRPTTVLLSKDGEAWRRWGESLHQSGKPEKAIEAFEASLKLDPTASKTYDAMAKSYKITGAIEAAQLCLSQAARLRGPG